MVFMVKNKIYATFIVMSLIILALGVSSEAMGFFFEAFNGNAGFMFASFVVLVIIAGFFKG